MHISPGRTPPIKRAIQFALAIIAYFIPITALAQRTESRPLLEALDRETKQLYAQVEQSLVRVELPAPQWARDAVERENPLKKWSNLSPEIQQQLQIQQAAAEKKTAPSTQGASGAAQRYQAIIVVGPQQRMNIGNLQVGRINNSPPSSVGLILDDKGHILVPLYVERETTDRFPVRIRGGGPGPMEATFVGSDRQTNVTILKLAKPAGQPIRLGSVRPDIGALMMFLMPADGSARLGLWTGGGREYSLVFGIDGQLAGIARSGQFLSSPACRLISDQIIRFGAVRRATLGVVVSEVPQSNGARQGVANLSVEQVLPGSAAEAGGVQVGDQLVAVAGEPVNDIPSLAAAIAARSGKTELQVTRGGEDLKVTVDLQQKK